MHELHARVQHIEKEQASIKRELKGQTKILVHMCRQQATGNKTLEETVGENKQRIVKLENDVGWIKKVGFWIVGALGLGHFFK